MSDTEDHGGRGGDNAPTAATVGTSAYAEELARLRQRARETESVLSTRDAATKVWLVKVPSFVADRWAEVNAQNPDGGVDLGTLRVESTPGEPASMAKISIKLPDIEWSQDLPRSYKLSITNLAPQRSYVFTEADSGKAEEVVGKIQHEAALTPILDDQYREIMRSRAQSASHKRKNIVTINERETKRNWRVHAANVAVDEGIALGAKKAPPTLDKRERLPRNDLVGLILDAFTEYPYWTFKGLQERTNQPHAWLKEVIGDVLVLVKSGAYHGHYTLKPELAKAGSMLGNGSGSGPSSSGKLDDQGRPKDEDDEDEDDDEDDDDDEDEDDFDVDRA
ncbi:hypothetical protein HK405_005918 [Cladochytrium tenue]|nr:hypothetical protein HK405_005918 [Cladochytrium tenue]